MDEALPFDVAARCLAELGHPHRLQIFEHLVRAGETGCAVGEVQAHLGIPKSSLSHHIAQLVGVGLVTQSREGRILRCRVERHRARLMKAFIDRCCEGLPG
ncbi:ArsR/SmtB family transcription factor [Lichenifustis flavocetrariae]|uniref:Metalloregulator ArsR/SmtB family transcription factor n=1 Tax=Lichenifustis flavocetrariae TaxID=2949735 RepID=A0AA42CML3_9HYPH|nr:metalloregulator ArsR/SmtB family transcription factor [Lichenifustis flavocetrariae]MCW6508507.1 metalloregulator ArsR/SmtB family transcription factor [Lichenifustis flavocetrariae]